MPVTDPVGDMLTRIRNAIQVHHESVLVPNSKMKLGLAILSTSKGLMAGRQAWRQGIGGELLCYVW